MTKVPPQINGIDKDHLEHQVKNMLEAFDQDPDREGLQDTPRRYIKFLHQFLTPPFFKFTTFKNEGTTEMIIVQDIPFYSLCEHHLAPFYGTGTIAYLPGDRLIGLSKLPRTLELYSRRLQNQERITNQVADRLHMELMPRGVAVRLEAEHLCIAMRGVEKPGTSTVTMKFTGEFENLDIKNQFLKLCIS